MNVDEVDQFNLFVSRDEQLISAKQGGRRDVSTNHAGYSVNKTGDKEKGYTYTYTLYKENFLTEGAYKLTFNSIDRAGNNINNDLIT